MSRRYGTYNDKMFDVEALGPDDLEDRVAEIRVALLVALSMGSGSDTYQAVAEIANATDVEIDEARERYENDERVEWEEMRAERDNDRYMEHGQPGGKA